MANWGTDKAKFALCKSPKTFRRLRPGKHTFEVAAIDGLGQFDATPIKKTFRIPKPLPAAG